MKNRYLLLVAAIAVALSLPTAGQASTGETLEVVIGGKLAASTQTQAGTNASAGRAQPAGATVSRRRARKTRWMPKSRASSEAWRTAREIYLDPEFTFDDYGARSCRRINRSKVRCYSYVSEDYYDEYGYYFDTILCDWFTTSYFTRSGRFKLWLSEPECVLLSEV